jgi:hypothetical protein
VALREDRAFTEEIRETLLNMSFEKWPFELIQMVGKHGRTMESTAREAYEKGLIERRHYLIYAQGTKEGKEAQELEDLENAAGGH